MSLIDLRLKEYRKQNESFPTRLVYPLTDRGWASEINKLALVMLYCLENKIELQLYTDGWNSGRWSNYFKPFCKTFKSPIKIPVYIFTENGKKRKLYRIFHNMAYRNTHLTDNARWTSIKEMSKKSRSYSYPEIGIDGDIFHALQQLFNILLRPIESLQNELDAAILPYQNKDVLGIHVRRGDKLIREAGMFPVQEYVEKAQSASFGFSEVFVASDSGQTLTEFQEALPNLKHSSFCNLDSAGHDQRTFNNRALDTRIAETNNIIKDIYILKASRYFVGTFSSNVGRLVHTLRNGKNSLSLDEDWYPG